MILTYIPVSMSIVLIIILLAMVIIGYLSEAPLELFKLINLVVPLGVFLIWGDPITRYLYRNRMYRWIVNLSMFKNLSYIHTLVVIVVWAAILLTIYVYLHYLNKHIRKKLQTEAFSFRFGKFNKILGSGLAAIRFYILASFLLIPLFMLGLIGENRVSDGLATVIMRHAPHATELTTLSSQPFIQKMSQLDAFLTFFNPGEVVNHFDALDAQLNDYHAQVLSMGYQANADDRESFLLDFIYHGQTTIDTLTDQALKEQYQAVHDAVSNYEPLFNLMVQNNILTFTPETIPFILSSDMPMTMDVDNESHPLLSVVQRDRIVYQWLQAEPKVAIDFTQPLTDQQTDLIIKRLIQSEHNQRLNDLLETLENEAVMEEWQAVNLFIEDYLAKETYPAFRGLSETLSIHERLFTVYLDQASFLTIESPFYAIYLMDALSVLEEAGITLVEDSIYQAYGKLIIHHVLLDGELDQARMTDQLKKVDRAIDQLTITNELAEKVLDALLEATVRTEAGEVAYLHHLLASGQVTEQALDVFVDYLRMNDYSDQVAIMDQLLADFGGEADATKSTNGSS